MLATGRSRVDGDDRPPTPGAPFGDNPRVTVTGDPSLPEGTRLVHIGPHKTGTTALQAALWNSRPGLLEQGVRHVGRSKNPSTAARAVVDQPSPYSKDKPPSIGDWKALVREIRRAHEPRVVVSSEFFGWAKPDAISRIRKDLDPARLYAAVTLRPIAKVIPSMWQQNVQQGTVAPFDDWVKKVVDRTNTSFWFLEGHDALIERWAAIVGTERMVAVVVDDQDHDVLMRAFEGLLGVRAGTLADVPDQTNRSLTWPEAEAVRAFNVAFNAENLPRDLHARTMRFGAAQHMKRRVPPRDEARVVLPSWAIEPITAFQATIVDNIRASGVRVVGDLDVLMRPAPAEAGEASGTPAIPPEVAASMAMGLMDSTGAIRTAPISRGPFKFAEPIDVARVPTYQLLGTVAGRTWRSVVGRVPLPGRRQGKA
jgi:hypothetical protein